MYSEQYYKQKYFKYKNKYLELKKQIGGEKPFNKELLTYNINFFTNLKMAKYLNPIYGLIYSEIGYISNNYYLNEMKLINTEENSYIKDITKSIPGDIQPTNKIMKLKPIDFGRYIAIKYIYMDNPGLIEIGGSGKVKLHFKNQNNIDNLDIENINNYINKLRKFFPLEKTNTNYFYILLYCFWWIANNYEGILAYYNGINEVIDIINRLEPIKGKIKKHYQRIDMTNESINNEFEKMIMEITNKPFKIYNQEWTKHFCATNHDPTYPDCGETVARNFINLMCFNGSIFDTEELKIFGPIKQLTDYYAVFDNFAKQSSNEVFEIFDEKLNARDAWSKLIIFYANQNLNFNSFCSNKNYGYELNDGMSKVKTKSNLLQLIQNLLKKVNNFNDINNNNIEYINDETENGIGNIYINTKKFGDITIKCNNGHYHMKIDQEIESYNYSKFNNEQQMYIKILLKEYDTIDNNNCILFNIDFNNFPDVLWNATNNELKQILLKLALTNKYDADLRRRMEIQIDDNTFNGIPLTDEKIRQKIGEITFIANNFNFLETMPFLKFENSYINNDITQIDLKPLKNIEIIKDNFIDLCKNLTHINFEPLANVKIIKNQFLRGCEKLTYVDLSHMNKINEIGDYFMFNCSGLINVKLPHIINVNKINGYLFSGCTSLIQIDLTPFQNVNEIGDYFLDNCSSLTNIDLSPLKNVTKIGGYFLNNCNGLTNVNLSPLKNVTKIESGFLNNCNNLTHIDFTPLQNVNKIYFSNFINSSKLEYVKITKKQLDNGFIEKYYIAKIANKLIVE